MVREILAYVQKIIKRRKRLVFVYGSRAFEKFNFSFPARGRKLNSPAKASLSRSRSISHSPQGDRPGLTHPEVNTFCKSKHLIIKGETDSSANARAN
jgi:hypothetical protein